MDHRLKAASVAAVILTSGLWSMSAPAAQNQQPGAGDQAKHAQTSKNAAEPNEGAGSNIFGSQELPKGLTIVPWKKTKPGSLDSKPTRLVDEPLEPIDPAEFKRRLDYYKQTQSSK